MVNAKKMKFGLVGLVCSCASFVIFSECSRETSLAEEVNFPVTDGFESSDVKKSSTGVFHKSVGAPVRKELGNAWIENYKRKNGKSFTYTIESSALSKMLANPLAEGIVMYYGVDINGSRYVLPIAIQSDGRLIKSEHVTTENGDIPWEKAISLIKGYSGKTRSHFFGANTFRRLIDEKSAVKIVGTSALDEDGGDQLLLSVDGEMAATEYEDRSNPCPPHCNDDQE